MGIPKVKQSDNEREPLSKTPNFDLSAFYLRTADNDIRLTEDYSVMTGLGRT